MENLTTILNSIPTEKIQSILLLSQLRKKNPAEIINTATITYFAKTLKPNLKDYETIYLENGKKLSAHMMKLKQVGKNPWKDGTHGMPDHLAFIFQSIDENEVNKAILEYAYRLIDITLTDIFDNGKITDIDKYSKALEQENFLYVMLQIAVRVIGLDLQEKGLVLENKTLDYMLNVLKADNKRIKNLFKECVSNGTPEIAIREYYNTMSNYLIDFENRRVLVTGHQIQAIGQETSLLNDVGEETVFLFLGYLLQYLKEKFQKQKQLFEKELITIR